MTEYNPSNEKPSDYPCQNFGMSDDEFMLELIRIYREFAKGQEPLGREFEELWDKHASELYEP